MSKRSSKLVEAPIVGKCAISSLGNIATVSLSRSYPAIVQTNCVVRAMSQSTVPWLWLPWPARVTIYAVTKYSTTALALQTTNAVGLSFVLNIVCP